MDLDALRYPRAARYLESLPAGLESYPECQARSEPIVAYWRDHGGTFAKEALPTPLADFFAGRNARQTWTSEVVYQTANLLIRDRVFGSDAAHLAWIRRYVEEAMRTPFFRAMMMVLSPTLVVMGASKRWAKAHQGSALTTAPAEGEPGVVLHTGTLTFPNGLLPELYLQGLQHAYAASVASAGAKDARVTLVGVEPGVARFEIRWTA